MRGFHIRAAETKDAESIAEILGNAFAEFVSLYTPGGYAATTPSAQQIRQRMAEGPMWVAEVDGGMVGTVSAVKKGADGLYVRGMAVQPSARGQHVGDSLMEAVHRFAVKNGRRRLFLSTTPFLTAAIRLYERFGFERTAEGPHDLFGTPLISMKKKLG